MEKRYNLSEAARELGLTRQGLYYWIEKGWVTPKRDYKGHPVFTMDDLKRIKKWKDKLKEV
jgi:DNA-binding transcriptional MerR regulator